MAEHTKGPWAVIGDDEGFDGVPYYEIAVGTCGTSSFKLLAHVQATFDDAGDGSWDLTTEDDANAHLIAAAPDLLEAGEDALDTCERLIADLREENAALHAQRIAALEMTAANLRAAIAKARNHPKGSH